ncbi:hypothetical protein ACNSOL_11945 (plasmid) [Aliarcobacter lanthieri]|uniref:hypothetical protein n=1 Tax=Aliarcobacter lanthieri TaxID=1355374 RepID=UPI003AAC82FC
MKIKFLTLFVGCFVFSQFLFAEVHNKIDKGYKSEDIEVGKHFYQEDKENVLNEDKDEMPFIKQVKGKNKIEELLSMILVSLEKQNRELENIKRNINPNEPKIIINDKGEKCLSNSSVDCFDIPIIQEARNVPVLYDFIKVPSEDTAKKWLLYQAKLFNHYIDMGYSLKFASLNGDEETYPVNALNIYGMAKDNITAQLYKDRILEILDDKKEVLGTMIFLGKSKNIEEQWGKDALGMLAFKKGKFFNIAVVFDTKQTKDEYDFAYKNNHDKQLVEVYNSLPKVVSKELFDKYKVNITPTAIAVYKDGKKDISSVIERGFLSQTNLIHNYQHFLVYNKIVEQKEFHSSKIWDTNIKDRLNEK